jgi:hypothetical protein
MTSFILPAYTLQYLANHQLILEFPKVDLSTATMGLIQSLDNVQIFEFLQHSNRVI